MKLLMTVRRMSPSFALAAWMVCSPAAQAALYINEIYFDPPGSDDVTQEYIELRGSPGMSLADIYLIFIENEDNVSNTGGAGQIEAIWDFNIADNGGVASIGSNGFLLGRQKNFQGTNYANVAAGTTVLTNAGSGIGFGSGAGSSTIGFSNLNGDGEIENSGFTAWLISKGAGSAPTLGTDLDLFNNGLDLIDPMHVDQDGFPTQLTNGWTILDSIGIHSDVDPPPSESLYGRLYAKVNFGGGPSSRIETGATYVDTQAPAGGDLELEYVGRWGDSTGQTPADWMVANLTDNAASGYTAAQRNYGISGNHGGMNQPEVYNGFTSQALPYGLDITDTFGSTNHPVPALASDGDYDDDNDVDADDIDILWHIVRGTGTDPNNNDTADLNGDSFVNEDDVDYMLANALDAGTNMRYGDANLSGGTPELTDYNRWRTGTGGWAGGDFDGSGGVPELNDYNLWRTGPTQFPGSVGSHGGGGPGAPLVPEPATLVLMGLGLPVLVLVARQRKRQ